MVERRKVSMISNTGPFMSALQCGQVDLLKQYIDRLFLPLSVRAEIERHGFGPQVLSLVNEGWIIPVDPTAEETSQAQNLARRIAASPLTNDKAPASHLPEAEAIVLVQRPELDAPRVLVEELAARQVCRDENISITGL
jgi:predicted nucleic acid-binding protein